MPVLTRTAQARLTETETLINNYLDDEVFQAYQRASQDAASGAVMLPGNGVEAIYLSWNQAVGPVSRST